MTSATHSDWKPKHQPHGVYCSPACGGKCKLLDHNRAQSEATKAAARLGKGWVAHVWENLGWYWSVNKGCMEIVPTQTGYRGYFNGEKQVISECIGGNPRDVIAPMVMSARQHVKLMTDQIDEVLA